MIVLLSSCERYVSNIEKAKTKQSIQNKQASYEVAFIKFLLFIKFPCSILNASSLSLTHKFPCLTCFLSEGKTLEQKNKYYHLSLF